MEYLYEQVTTLQSEFWICCNLLNSKSVNDANKELQQFNLLLTKAFARRTDVLRSYTLFILQAVSPMVIGIG